MRIVRLALAAAALGACVPYPAELLPQENGAASQYALVEGAYPGLEAGANELVGLHFKVRAYGASVSQETLDLCEASYVRIMTDTGLYSFIPRGTYSVVVYGTQDEYRKKTGQPEWSAGVTVGNAIYSWSSPALGGVLAHETTHLIWYEYMNGRLSDQQRWVNEGLAVYEESKARARGHELFGALLPALRAAPMPLDQLQNLAPNTERAYDASLWYAQAESMIRFMIERGGRIGFGHFLESIRQGRSFDQAMAGGFPGQWQTLAAFEAAWRANLQ